MSVLSHLQNRANAAVLTSAENSSIDTSIGTLQTRLASWFGSNISQQFRFGSHSRGTILPRSMDAHSDIDYMVVFSDASLTGQTYLNRLKAFAEAYYSTSSIRQSSPSVVLELNHIMFDLVPARVTWYGSLEIPTVSGSWINTDPTGFSTQAQQANVANSYLLKPAIRLFKYWNAIKGYPYDSYDFERKAVAGGYWLCSNIKDYLFAMFDARSEYEHTAQWRIDAIRRAKEIVANVRTNEAAGLSVAAETEVKKLIPA
jgi:hypothetical protein